MKVEIKGGIYRCQLPYNIEPYYSFFGFDASDEDRVKVIDHTIELDIPDDFDPRPGMVAALEKQKKAAMAEFQARITEIDGRIQSLLAIEA